VSDTAAAADIHSGRNKHEKLTKKDDSKYSTMSNNNTHHQESTIILSSAEKENLRYNMKDDKVVVFYKKILGEIRNVIREERSGIQKYLK
jgi:hypothetical protein